MMAVCQSSLLHLIFWFFSLSTCKFALIFFKPNRCDTLWHNLLLYFSQIDVTRFISIMLNYAFKYLQIHYLRLSHLSFIMVLVSVESVLMLLFPVISDSACYVKANLLLRTKFDFFQYKPSILVLVFQTIYLSSHLLNFPNVECCCRKLGLEKIQECQCACEKGTM